MAINKRTKKLERKRRQPLGRGVRKQRVMHCPNNCALGYRTSELSPKCPKCGAKLF